MNEKTFMFLAFDSTHKAIHFERLLMSQFAIELIPTPREVTASCGISLKFEPDDHNAIMDFLIDEDKTGLRLYQYFKDGKNSRAVESEWEVTHADQT